MNSDRAAAPGPWGALIDPQQLHGILNEPGTCILDCRHDLAQPESGRAQYEKGHIPGAIHAHLDHDLAGPATGTNGRHPLPDPPVLAWRLQSWGAGTHSQIVVYDASDGSYAARAWWLLRWLGHEHVAVLDGGWPAWHALGFAASREIPMPAPGDFAIRPSLASTVTVEKVLEYALSGDAARELLLDARAPDRYEGRNETIDPVAGHIPGAVNRFWKQNLTGDGRFKPATQLRAEYEALLDGRTPKQVMLQCGSGVTACHDALAMHVAGLPGAALYPGSWSEWVADPSRPVARG